MSLRIVDLKTFQEDTEKSKRLVDELCGAVLNLASGGAMGYNSFIQTRDEFKEHLELVAKSYKTVEVE